MATSIRGSKRPVEKVLVVKTTQDLPTDGTPLSGAGGIVNLNDGQVGLLDVTPGSSTFNQFFNNAGSLDYTQVPVAKVVQGTDMSATPSQARIPFTRRPYEDSHAIIGKQVKSYTGKVYAGPKESASVVPVTSANAVELSKYSLNISFRGRRVTEFDSGIQAVVRKTVEYNTPDYTALATTNPNDDIVQNLCFQVYQNSRQFNGTFGNLGGNWAVIAFAVDLSGGAGVAINSAVSTSVPVVVSNSGTQSITITQELFDTFADVVTNTALTGASTIELIDPTTFGSGTADYILLVALSEVPAYIDRDPTLHLRIDLGAGDKFQELAVSPVVGCNPFEGEGTYRQWKIYFDNTNGQRSYSQNRDLYPVLVYPTSLDPTATYSALILEHYDSAQVQFTGTSISPLKTVVLIPSGSANRQNIVDAFNNWLAPSFPPVTL
jgi:hypothetical protein